MRLLFCLTLFCFTMINALSQELKLIATKNDFYTEEFEVLKADRKIKNGSYIKKLSSDTIVKGTFKNNQRIGIWEFYDLSTRKLEQKYDYDNSKLLYMDNSNQKPYNFLYNSSWRIDNLDTVPYLIGGLSELKLELMETLLKNLYLNNSLNAGIIVLSFIIDKNGATKNHKISMSAGNTFEKNLVNVVLDYPNKWIPGSYNGEKVEAELVLPIFIGEKTIDDNKRQYIISFDNPIKK